MKAIIIKVFTVIMIFTFFQILQASSPSVTSKAKETKIIFKYMAELGIHSPSIDKNTLPDNMKNSKFYNILDIDETSSIENIIEAYISGNQHEYDCDYVPLEVEGYCGVYEKSLILLFDENKQLLGYATFPKIDGGETYVHFYEYNKWSVK